MVKVVFVSVVPATKLWCFSKAYMLIGPLSFTTIFELASLSVELSVAKRVLLLTRG